MNTTDFLDLRRKTLAQLRQASDAIRDEIGAHATDRSILPLYLENNQRYFKDGVLTGQLVQSDTAARVTESGPLQDPYYMTILEDVARLRTGRGNVSGFEVLHPAFLEPLTRRLFSCLDTDRTFETEDQFLCWLAVADFTLQLVHPVKDGTGRSGEDLLALLSRRHGYPLTFSTTGYRAALDTPDRDLFHRHVTERIGFIEFTRHFLTPGGAPLNNATPWQVVDVMKHLLTHGHDEKSLKLSWPKDLSEQIEEFAAPVLQHNSSGDELLKDAHPYQLYAAFVVREITYLLLNLEDTKGLFPDLLRRYPLSMGCRVANLKAARHHRYLEMPNSITSTADDVMARIDLLRLGKLDKNDAELKHGLEDIQKWNVDLGTLIERESSSQSMEKLLQRLRVPKGWALTPQEFRATINQTTEWSI